MNTDADEENSASYSLCEAYYSKTRFLSSGNGGYQVSGCYPGDLYAVDQAGSDISEDGDGRSLAHSLDCLLEGCGFEPSLK